ncbi:MAG: prepilin-type N-terminal cleavage/methylation domain-containing protein [Candidatus Omnitrophica bacterium]|nr:prepilin-type N-terminal cleavage/methylation domain-containing protein [Candidatus Omnitrophota bacterium]
MNQRKGAFTLIELIIVVVIIGILALVAIPKYFANIAKAQRSQVYSNLNAMREAILAYYAANGIYPADYGWPITVVIDGDTIMNVSNPSDSYWVYFHASASSLPLWAYKQPGNSCWYGMYFSGTQSSTCTP